VVIVKTCIKCKQSFPKTLEYFSKKGKYLESYCKKCSRLKGKAFYAANSEKQKQVKKMWKQANPEKARHYSRSQRARKQGNEVEFYTLEEVFKIYGTNCYLCDMPINLEVSGKFGSNPQWKSGLHIEHFIPINLGGPDTIENVRPSHAWCNIAKGAK
jgi:5-methylcytosine-specific restriction endonuclease McrA